MADIMTDVTDSKKIAEPEKTNEQSKDPASGDVPDAKGFQWGFGNKSSKAVTIQGSKNSLDYNMNHPNRGVALIFNHKNFDSELDLPVRQGTDVDRGKLEALANHLGFTEENTHVFNDLSRSEVKKQLNHFAKRDYSDDDCLMVAICTHGDQGKLYARDRIYSSEDLWEPFSGEKCKTLAGKPKLFFIQACQGDRIDPGVSLEDSIDGYEKYYKIPTFADFLIAYSTFPGFYSWRDLRDGSWFMQALCDIFKEHSVHLDLLGMLTLVNHKVSHEFASCVPDVPEMDQKKQIPCITSMLTRRVWFKPKNGTKSENRTLKT